jgi:hypothetical protein
MENDMHEGSNGMVNRRAMLGMTAAALAESMTACSRSTVATSVHPLVRRRFENKLVVVIDGGKTILGA